MHPWELPQLSQMCSFPFYPPYVLLPITPCPQTIRSDRRLCLSVPQLLGERSHGSCGVCGSHSRSFLSSCLTSVLLHLQVELIKLPTPPLNMKHTKWTLEGMFHLVQHVVGNPSMGMVQFPLLPTPPPFPAQSPDSKPINNWLVLGTFTIRSWLGNVLWGCKTHRTLWLLCCFLS